MESFIESIPYSNWPELVTDLKKNENGSSIYRGHSNDYQWKSPEKAKLALQPADFCQNIKFKHWPIISSFDRYYNGHFYKFSTFLSQQIEDNIFRVRYGSYNLSEIFYLRDCTQLERIYYLQHYGLHTCFIDFSHKPLIALFFSIANVRSTNIYSVINHKPIFHPPDAYISCYELNHDRISELFNIRKLDKDFSYKTYGNYRVKNWSVHLAFDLTPMEKCMSNTLNENLKLQYGCFVLYDNDGSDLPLEKLFDSLAFYQNIGKEVVIKEYRLPYIEIFARHDFEGLTNITLFEYLDKNNISGRTLFNDIQGLKYDINFFHQ